MFKNTIKYFTFQIIKEDMMLKNNTTVVPLKFAVNSGELPTN